jgi:predicted tellurium resistance membrane protein TerC
MGTQTAAILLTIGILLLFGSLYALLINWMRREGYLEGYTGFAVVGGVAVTLIVNKAIHNPDPLYDLLFELACFAAAGLPMIIEQSYHYAQQRRRNQDTIIAQVAQEAGDA